MTFPAAGRILKGRQAGRPSGPYGARPSHGPLQRLHFIKISPAGIRYGQV